MTRQDTLRHVYVEYIPEKLEPGVIYVSKRYRTASHLCSCGCGLKVVTPLNPAKWTLTDHGQTISLLPSIGNWGFPCKSHYWIDHSRIRWAGEMSERQIANVRRNDRLATEQYAVSHPSILSRFRDAWKRWFGGKA